MSVLMAIVDFIPVILFLLTAVLLQRDLYYKMSKGCYALFAGGTIMIVAAGTMKAIWKLLYNTGICDFERLTQTFFPMQALGFILTGIAMIAMVTVKQTENKLYSAAVPAVFSGTMIFVAGTIFGVGALCTVLSILSVRLKKARLIPLLVLTFFLLLGMGYLSTKDFSQAFMNWIAEFVNIAAQLLLYLSVRIMHKAGLAEL